LMAISMGIPVINLFTSYFLFKNINFIIQKKENSFDVNAAILSMVFCLLAFTSHFEEPYFFIAAFSWMPLIIAQKELNSFFRKGF